MIFVELHDKNGDPFKVNPAAILFYKPYGEHLSALTMYYGLDSINVIVKESYEEVNSKMQYFEMVNDNEALSLHIGIQQYLDFLNSTKPSMLRDEYLKWKGKREFLSKKRWINADELLAHIWRDELDTREKIANLVESLIERDKDDPNEND